MIVAGTGHRPQRLGISGPCPLSRSIVHRMSEELDRLQPTRVISGMALGVDQWLAWLAVRGGVPFTAALPCEGQESRWNFAQRNTYLDLLDHSDHVEMVTAGPYDPGCMQRRNEWMVDRCDVLLAVWNGSDGGTANCVRYAEKVGRKIVRIDPR